MNIKCGHCKRHHTNIAAVKNCAAWFGDTEARRAEEEAETREIIRAEAGMSWVCSGGNPEDAGWYAAQVLAGRM